METVGKSVASRATEARRFVPSVVQPTELSRRQDSSTLAIVGEGAKGRQADAKLATGTASAGRFADQKRVDEAAAWISATVASTLRKGAEDVGEYVLETFFSNDPGLAKSRNPHKNASYRALAAKCGTPELPVSKTWLNNAVGIAVMLRRLPAASGAFRALPPSYQETLLPLGDPEKVEKMAKEAASSDLTCRELRQVVADQRARTTRADQRGRPPTAPLLKEINRSLRLFTSGGNKRVSSTTDLEKMDTEQRRTTLRSVEGLIGKLKDLARRLRGA